jgi:hypothetical protein
VDAERVRRIAFIVVVTAALAFAFAARARGEWVWDDVYLVEKNPELVAPGGLWSILTHDLWGGATGEPTQFYRPVPLLVHWVEAHVFGVSLRPMRLVNVLIHTVNGALLFVWVRRGMQLSETAARYAAAAFLLHPSATEPVMWLTGLTDSLGVTFTLCALVARPRWWLAAVFTACAVLSKELYAVVPMLLLLEPLRARAFRPAMLLPFGAVALVFVVRWTLGISTATGATHVALADHVRCAGTLLAHYGLQLATFRNGMTTETYSPIPLGVAVVVLAAFGGIAFVLSKRRLPESTAMLWFGLALAPNIASLPLIGMFGNRYAYLPLVGFALLVGLLVQRLEAHRLASVVGWALMPGAMILGLATAGEASLWVSSLSLFGADVDRAPNDPHSLYHFGHAVFRRQGCGAALPFYERAVTADPGYQRAWHNVAGCLINERRFEEAIPAAERALELAPNEPRAEYNLGTALVNAGRIAEGRAHLARGRPGRSLEGKP